MNSIRIVLPGNIVVETDVQSATALLQNLSNIQLTQDRMDKVNLSSPEKQQPKGLTTLQVEKDIQDFSKEIKSKKIKSSISYGTKTVTPDMPRVSKIEREFIAQSFHYSPSKQNSKGRAAYIASILMDRQIHTVPQLIEQSNSNTSTLSFVLERLRKNGCKLDTTSVVLTKNTLVQLISIPKINKNTFDKSIIKSSISNVSSSSGFKNLAI